jgi:hypothetical protein
MIENPVYTAHGAILVTIDGAICTVPDDMANRDRRKLAAWEAEGGVIAPYVPREPEPTPPDPVAGKLAELEAAIAALKTAGIITDAMIEAARAAPSKAAGLRAGMPPETLRR